MLLVGGCSSASVVNTGEAPTTTATPAPPKTTPPASNAHLVNAFDYVGHVAAGAAAYYFTSPSGRWRCAIITRTKAGCQPAGAWRAGLGIAGTPATVPDATGADVAPNAVIVGYRGEPQLVALDRPEFWAEPGPAAVLPFNRILAAAGFRCNVQEQTGVSCRDEATGGGFTFSLEEYSPHYTDVPADAP